MPIRFPLVLGVMLSLMAPNLCADELEHLGTFTWPSEGVVGLSGLEVSDDGTTFWAVGDRGWHLSGRFDRDGGIISGVTVDSYQPILGNDGWPVAARRIGDWSDAEGLAIGQNGEYWISFERWARVARFTSPDAPAQWIKDDPSFSDYRDNRQLEALAIHPDGSLITMPERPQSDGFPMYQLEDNGWSIRGYIQEHARFSIVGADFADNGDMYLLERKLVLGLWWQNRVRRLQLDAPDAAEILWTGGRGEFYNLEGIAVWTEAGALRLTIVSDNNGDNGEPTQFVDFRVVETP